MFDNRPLRIVTQTDNIERGNPNTTADNWMDDCAWATIACAANHLTGSSWTSHVSETWGEAVGRHDRNGFGDGTTLQQLVDASPMAGIKPRWAHSWDDVLAALRSGAIVGINVEQPRGYPAGLQMSVWHKHQQKRKPGSTYGHMTCAALSVDGTGAQWADPTMSGAGSEKYAVPVSFDGLKAIASSKHDPKGPHARCIIWMPIKRVAQEPAPAPAAGAPGPSAPAPILPVTKPAERNPAPFDYQTIVVPQPGKLHGLTKAIARVGNRLMTYIAK